MTQTVSYAVLSVERYHILHPIRVNPHIFIDADRSHVIQSNPLLDVELQTR